MSYLHCPICSRAYNLTHQSACPSCGVRAGTLVDPTEEVVAAAEQLARAVARASQAQLDAATAAMDRRWRVADDTAPSILQAVRASLARPVPASSVVTGPAKQALLVTVALALLTRIAPRKPVFGIRALLAR